MRVQDLSLKRATAASKMPRPLDVFSAPASRVAKPGAASRRGASAGYRGT